MEELGFVDPEKRVTKRLVHYIISLCLYLTVKEIAQHLRLAWETVKTIYKEYPQAKFSQKIDKNPHLLAVDEVAVRKGHHYSTIILNGDTGQVLYGEKEEDMKP